MNNEKLNICFLDPEWIWDNKYFDIYNWIEPIWAISVAENIKTENRNVDFVQQLTKSNKEIIDIILSKKPNVLAVTSYSYNFSNSLEIVREIKKSINDLIVVYWWIHVTYCPEESLNTDLIDFIVRNEWEITFNELLNYFENWNNNYSNINWIWFKKNWKIIITKDRERIKNLSELNFSRRDWLDMDYKKESFCHLPISQIKNAWIEKSRWCWFNCEFCTSKDFWKWWNILKKDLYKIIDEIKYLYNQFWTNYLLFSDERFIIKWRKEDIELLDLMIEENIWDIINYSCFNTLRDVDQDVLYKLKKSWCSYINYWVEAIDIEVIKKMRKKHNVIDNARNVFQMTKNADIFWAALFMIGSPYETIANIDKLEKYVLENADVIDKIRIAFYTPFPWTKSFEESKKSDIFHNRVFDSNNSIWYDSFTTKEVVITPKWLIHELWLDNLTKIEQDIEVEKYLKIRKKEIMTKFYTSEKYLNACLERINKNQNLKNVYKEWFLNQSKIINNYLDYIPNELKNIIWIT